MKNENNYGIQNVIDNSRFNDYLKLLHVTAYVICFVKNLKQKFEKQSLNLQFLQLTDIENAEFEWIRIAQKGFFSNKSYFNQLKIKFGVFLTIKTFYIAVRDYSFPIYQKILKTQFYYQNSNISPIS